MDISQPITIIKGVGDKTALAFEKAGIVTVRDLLYFLPRAYENYQSASAISSIRPGKITVRAVVDGVTTTHTRRRGFSITEATLRDKTGAIRAVWFNQPYRANQFEKGKEYYFAGNFEFARGRYQLTSPSVKLAADIGQTSSTTWPVYSQKAGLKPVLVQKILNNLRSGFVNIPDMLPGHPGRADALFKVHFPESEKDTVEGREYLAFEELFELLLASYLNRQVNQKLSAVALPFSAANTKQLVASLPFAMTGAQRRATWDILQDLEKPVPMNRLLQGDVGSGKTVVAAIAAHQVAAAGHQTALLAPTEILATQHANTISALLSPLGIKVALLTGSTKNKTELKKRIKSGEVDVVVGTHALLTDDTGFHSLSLAVIDEQHRFGVKQRQALLSKINVPTQMPHLLSMTATPIPRSLQLTIFGDLDVSILDELPKGRQPIITKILPQSATMDVLYPAIRDQLGRGHQVYYICKSIEDTPASDVASVKKQVARIADALPSAKVAYLHGKMKPAEKDAVMGEFAGGKINILVSTTVVEVGVDVPNATLIAIANAELYGLAQLHQLRGRVGRGGTSSYCYLLIDSEAQPSRRLRELEKSTDGFYLAEVDLKLRGPGEIYGALQHGALDLRIASITDTKLVAQAQKEVQAFVKSGGDVLQYKELAHSVHKYQRLTTLN